MPAWSSLPPLGRLCHTELQLCLRSVVAGARHEAPGSRGGRRGPPCGCAHRSRGRALSRAPSVTDGGAREGARSNHAPVAPRSAPDVPSRESPLWSGRSAFDPCPCCCFPVGAPGRAGPVYKSQSPEAGGGGSSSSILMYDMAAASITCKQEGTYMTSDSCSSPVNANYEYYSPSSSPTNVAGDCYSYCASASSDCSVCDDGYYSSSLLAAGSSCTACPYGTTHGNTSSDHDEVDDCDCLATFWATKYYYFVTNFVPKPSPSSTSSWHMKTALNPKSIINQPILFLFQRLKFQHTCVLKNVHATCTIYLAESGS